jgi:hypothetical protein
MTTTIIPAAVVAQMRLWLADLAFGDLTSADVLDAAVVSDADVIAVVDRLYAGGTAAFVLTEDLARLAAGVSDAQLLEQVAVVLDGRPGPRLYMRLSTAIAHVCHAHFPPATADGWTGWLTMRLADYLHSRHVLRETQVSPDGLDAWAETCPLPVLRAAVRACGRSVGGDLR